MLGVAYLANQRSAFASGSAVGRSMRSTSTGSAARKLYRLCGSGLNALSSQMQYGKWDRRSNAWLGEHSNGNSTTVGENSP